MRAWLLPLATLTALSAAAAPAWLDLVSPIIKPSEKKAYLSLSPAEREKFQQKFWDDKSIPAAEYFRRVEYIDTTFGSRRTGSGANTDPGRVYLALGPPTSIKRIPSSRIFVPLEIWYYDTVPGLISTELRLIFYQKNSLGFPKLYSPELDTIRALLLPQAATIKIFGPNDTISEASLRMSLNISPAEDEVISAAVNVATGIKNSGNGEIIGRVLSPAEMLTRDPQSLVKSRLIAQRPPKVDFLLSKSPYGAQQIDIAVEVTAQREIAIEVLDDAVTVYQNSLALKLTTPEPLQYLHRLDLLPGSYRIAIKADGKASYFPLDVPAQPATSEIVIAAETPESTAHDTPFEFEGSHLYPAPDGHFAILTLAEPAEVQWIIRRGTDILWRQKSPARAAAILPLPDALQPGRYDLEATTPTESRRTTLEIARKSDDKRTLFSFNANLAPASRHALVGHEWLLRGDTVRAVDHLKQAPVQAAQIDLARIEALQNRWDQARNRLRPILAADPDNFDALCVFAYIEAQLQDFAVAAEYYQRALAIQDSPAVRLALNQLPK